MGHVAIDKTSCLYIHGIYMRSCLYIHESSVYVHMTAIALDASESRVTVYTGVVSLLTIRHVFIYMAFHRVVSLYTWSIHGIMFRCIHVSIYNESCLYTPDVYMGSCVEMHEACRHLHMTAITLGANWSAFDRYMGHFSINNQSCLYTYYSEYATCKLPRHLRVHMYMYARIQKYICI